MLKKPYCWRVYLRSALTFSQTRAQVWILSSYLHRQSQVNPGGVLRHGLVIRLFTAARLSSPLRPPSGGQHSVRCSGSLSSGLSAA